MRGALEPDERLPITPARRYRAEWAVVIGIDAYPGGDGLRPLLYAANDASAVRRLLIEDFGYRPERVLFLRDGGATRSAITHSSRRSCHASASSLTTRCSSSSPGTASPTAQAGVATSRRSTQR